MFPYYIAIQYYIIFILFVMKLPFAERYLFILLEGEIFFFFFYLIKACARVVKLNECFLQENRRFYIAFHELFNAVFRRAHPGYLLKAEWLQHSRRLHSYSFYLFTKYRIT